MSNQKNNKINSSWQGVDLRKTGMKPIVMRGNRKVCIQVLVLKMSEEGVCKKPTLWSTVLDVLKDGCLSNQLNHLMTKVDGRDEVQGYLTFDGPRHGSRHGPHDGLRHLPA